MAKNKKKAALQAEVIEQSFKAKNTMTFDSKELPAIKDWKNGEKYRLKEVIIKQTSSDLMDDGSLRNRFEVIDVKADKKPVK